MFLHKLKLALAVLMVLSTGAAVVAYQGVKKSGQTAKADPAGPDAVKVSATAIPKDELNGPIAEWSIIADKNPKTKSIQTVLEKPIAMKFANETPLEDVKKYIKTATKDEKAGFPTGLPIYVDPWGLQDADKTMQSTVQIDLEGVPLKDTLRLLLKQIGMTYNVRDGILVITSLETDDVPTAFRYLMELAEQGKLTKEQYKELAEILKLRNEIRKLDNAQ